MSDTMPCPGCKATLRIPATAAAIRCPACKTVITIEAKSTKPAATQAPAIPLPFNQPAQQSAQAPEETESELPTANKPSIRAKVIRDEDPEEVQDEKSVSRGDSRRQKYDEDDQNTDDSQKQTTKAKSKKRNSLLDFEDHELDDDELKEKRKLEKLGIETRYARTGTKLLAIATAFECAAYLIGFLYLVVATFGYPLVPIAWFGMLLHVVGLIIEIVSMGYCMAAPKKFRSMAVWSIVISVITLLTLSIAFYYSWIGHAALFTDSSLFGKGSSAVLWVIAPITPTIEFMNLPLWVVEGTLINGAWFIVIPGLFELARHSYTTIIMRSFSEEAKAPEHGWRVSRFVFRLYVSYGIFFVTRCIATGLVMGNVCGKEDPNLLIYLGLTYAGTLAAICVTLFAQCYALFDTVDIVEYKRFALKGTHRLEVD